MPSNCNPLQNSLVYLFGQSLGIFLWALVPRLLNSSHQPGPRFVQVFPGGAVDPADRASSTHFRPGGTDVKSNPLVQHSRHSAPGPPEHVIRVAACREAFEEAGVPIVTPQPPQHEWFAACAKWRQAVHDDASKFPQFCGDIKVRSLLPPKLAVLALALVRDARCTGQARSRQVDRIALPLKEQEGCWELGSYAWRREPTLTQVRGARWVGPGTVGGAGGGRVAVLVLLHHTRSGA